MRTLTATERTRVAGGRQFNASHDGSAAGLSPDLKKLPPGSGDPSEPGVVVNGWTFDAPPDGFDSWWDFDAMSTFYWEAAPADEGGGGGPSQPFSYNDGVHNVYATTATSANGHNNPGDIMHKDSQGNYVLNTYATEQDGLDALASLMDNATYENMQIGNMGSTYAPDDPSYPNQAENWENNVENYMAEHGYGDASTETPGEMSDAEFNTFLNAISVAEGNTNMG